MALELDESTTVVGQIEIAIVLREGGSTGIEYGLDGLSTDEAIGHLIVVLDRIREERRYEWDTCPECFRPWDEHPSCDDEEEE